MRTGFRRSRARFACNQDKRLFPSNTLRFRPADASRAAAITFQPKNTHDCHSHDHGCIDDRALFDGLLPLAFFQSQFRFAECSRHGTGRAFCFYRHRALHADATHVTHAAIMGSTTNPACPFFGDIGIGRRVRIPLGGNEKVCWMECAGHSDLVFSSEHSCGRQSRRHGWPCVGSCVSADSRPLAVGDPMVGVCFHHQGASQANDSKLPGPNCPYLTAAPRTSDFGMMSIKDLKISVDCELQRNGNHAHFIRNRKQAVGVVVASHRATL